MSTNVSASTSASGSSTGNQAQGLPSPTPTEAGEGRSEMQLILTTNWNPQSKACFSYGPNANYSKKSLRVATLKSLIRSYLRATTE
uniref:Uncharacterized protein n=1 Tax=Moniliophthora roreri TaxID=221103 RepID=A0A0W0FGG6_MONRR